MLMLNLNGSAMSVHAPGKSVMANGVMSDGVVARPKSIMLRSRDLSHKTSPGAKEKRSLYASEYSSHFSELLTLRVHGYQRNSLNTVGSYFHVPFAGVKFLKPNAVETLSGMAVTWSGIHCKGLVVTTSEPLSRMTWRDKSTVSA